MLGWPYVEFAVLFFGLVAAMIALLWYADMWIRHKLNPMMHPDSPRERIGQKLRIVGQKLTIEYQLYTIDMIVIALLVGLLAELGAGAIVVMIVIASYVKFVAPSVQRWVDERFDRDGRTEGFKL